MEPNDDTATMLEQATRPKLSVVIPNYCGPHLTEVLVAALELPADEIVLVDSSPQPPELPAVCEGKVQLVHLSEKTPPGKARNVGAKKAKGEFLLFVDSDVILKPSAIEFLHEQLKEPTIALISGGYDPEKPSESFWAVIQNQVIRHRMALSGPNGERQFYSSHFLIPRKLFREVGQFNETMWIYEDVEFATRMVSLGEKHELEDSFEAVHLRRFSFAGLVREYLTKSYHVGRARMRYPHVFAGMPSFVSKPLISSWLLGAALPLILVLGLIFLPVAPAIGIVAIFAFILFALLGPVLRPLSMATRLRALLGWPLLGSSALCGTLCAKTTGTASRLGFWILSILDFARCGMRVILRNGTPIQIINYVTARCNLRCDHCFYKETLDAPDPGEISIDVFDKTTKSMGPLLWYAFAGGEPVVRKDLIDVMEVVAKNSRPKVFSLPTNGWYSDKTFDFALKALQRVDPRTSILLFFSVDGPKKIHDEIRGPGSFDRVKETIKRLKPLTRIYPQLHLNVTFTVTPQSAKVAPEFIKQIASEFQPNAISVSLFRYHTPDHPALPDYLLEGYRQACENYEEILRSGALQHYGFMGGRVLLWKEILQKDLIYRVAKNDEFVTPCTAGNLSYVIMEDGRLLPCEILSDSLGKVTDEGADFKKMIKSSTAKELRTRIVDEKCKCTYECSMSTNTLFSWPMSRRLAGALTGEFFGGKKNKSVLAKSVAAK